jgi:hypothetical protein
MGVDAEGEEVLIVGCHDAGSDDGAVGDGVADVDGVGGKDAQWIEASWPKWKAKMHS